MGVHNRGDGDGGSSSSADNPFAPPEADAELTAGAATLAAGAAPSSFHGLVASPVKRLLGALVSQFGLVLSMSVPALLGISLAEIGGQMTESPAQRSTFDLFWFLFWFLGSILGGVLYVALNMRLVHQRGQTVGKLVVGTYIVTGDGQNASVGRVAWRVCAEFLLAVISILQIVDCLLVFSKDRRTIHDHMASTWVVDSRILVWRESGIAVGVGPGPDPNVLLAQARAPLRAAAGTISYGAPVVLTLVGGDLGRVLWPSDSDQPFMWLVGMIGLWAAWGVANLLLVWLRGETLSRLIVGLRTVREDGTPATTRAKLGRIAAEWGCIWATTTIMCGPWAIAGSLPSLAGRRTIWDDISRTYVVEGRKLRRLRED